jgi:hypothetical protein
MSTTLYKNLAPVNKGRHANWSIVSNNRFDHAKSFHAIPLTAIEFPQAVKDFAVVFAQNNEEIMPIAIVGVRTGENLYLDAEGKWTAKYVPAYVRRYPFIFSTNDGGEILTLCLDEAYEGCRQASTEGDRLFTDAGENSAYLNNVLAFLKEFQGHFIRTQAFGNKLKELDLLEPMGAQFKTQDGKEGTLSGFAVVSREKLKKLSAEQLAELVATDALEMIYLHLSSLSNLNETVKRAG